jgi:hypothetical protein
MGVSIIEGAKGLLTLLSMTNSVLAYDGTGYGAKWSNYSGTTDIDTRRASYWMNYYCENYGGYNIYQTTSDRSSNIYNYAKQIDELEFSFGHCNAGFIQLVGDNDGVAPWDATYIIAGLGGESNTSNNYYLSTYSSSDVDDLLLWVFGGCYTGNTSATYGNLLTRAAGKGVDCAIGFTSTVMAPTSNSDTSGNLYWKEFWYWAAVQGYTMQGACNYALQNLIALEGSAQGFNTVTFNGEVGSGISILPARAGS